MRERSRPASGVLTKRTRKMRTIPKHTPGVYPPSASEDEQLHAVADGLRKLDPDGSRIANVLRDTIDQLLDGERTGRWDWATLHKTEKTHMGTLVEIGLHKEFEFADGTVMDYDIDGIEVDCKFSQEVGGWEMPPESLGHLCLVVSANDDAATWSAGLIRVEDHLLRTGRRIDGLKGNRDGKRKLTDEGESRILWLFETASLPRNIFLELSDEAREAIFSARTGNRSTSGQARLKEMFRRVPGQIVRRSAVYTVAMQDDSMKRARDCRLERHLGREGFLILGHLSQDRDVAEALGLPKPDKGELVSVRVHPAKDWDDAPVAEINGTYWRIARPTDPAVVAPNLRSTEDEG
ncbi:MAG: hypothetical protein J7513_17175 [Solirubrobacteraceae bacterium]|nr:hypothetical protein [Solirubrobacteraceae bacterium]